MDDQEQRRLALVMREKMEVERLQRQMLLLQQQQQHSATAGNAAWNPAALFPGLQLPAASAPLFGGVQQNNNFLQQQQMAAAALLGFGAAAQPTPALLPSPLPLAAPFLAMPSPTATAAPTSPALLGTGGAPSAFKVPQSPSPLNLAQATRKNSAASLGPERPISGEPVSSSATAAPMQNDDANRQQQAEAAAAQRTPDPKSETANTAASSVALAACAPAPPPALPMIQFTPEQLQLAMRHFFRIQQQHSAAKEESPAGQQEEPVREVKEESAAAQAADIVLVQQHKSCASSSSVSSPSSSPAVAGALAASSSSTTPRPSTEAECAGGEEEDAAEDYVDVVGDGQEGRSSMMRFQRKAHIEFYRKLKAFRSRGAQLECQMCAEHVQNTDASVRSHIHAHCRTAQFVCKLCQRGFQDQHHVFEHINVEHPLRKGTQCIEDRRDMKELMQLLADCFPRVVCRAKDCLAEHIARLVDANAGGQPIQCRLCAQTVEAQKQTLITHLSRQHPTLKCKRCKFSCLSCDAQLEHQRKEHKECCDESDPPTGEEKPYYSMASPVDVQFEAAKMCFPLAPQKVEKAPKKRKSEEQEEEEERLGEEEEESGKVKKRRTAAAGGRRRKRTETEQRGEREEGENGAEAKGRRRRKKADS